MVTNKGLYALCVNQLHAVENVLKFIGHVELICDVML